LLRPAELLPLNWGPKHHILAPDDSSNFVPISLQMGCLFVVVVDELPLLNWDIERADAASGKLANRARARITATALLLVRSRLILQNNS